MASFPGNPSGHPRFPASSPPRTLEPRKVVSLRRELLSKADEAAADQGDGTRFWLGRSLVRVAGVVILTVSEKLSKSVHETVSLSPTT